MFISLEFIAFILGLFVLYYLVPKKCQWMLLLVANFLFYSYANIYYPIYLLITASTVYFAARWIHVYNQKVIEYNEKIRSGEIPKPTREEKKAYKKQFAKKKKAIMLCCLLLNLGILAVVKYTNFVLENVNFFTSKTGCAGITFVDLIVPMGISFYTFQAIGYLLDVYWEKGPVQKNYFKFVLFVSFFPQLIQGPISRYSHLSKTMYEEHSFDWKNIRFGFERILWGYFKKLVIADRVAVAIGALADVDNLGQYTGGYVFIAMMFYALQLYADFTGGIDITIGVAQILGIHLEENFIRPYFSKNIAEYWRRWHISMGTWFRDYVFYPCGISRPVKTMTTFCKKHFGMFLARRVAVYFSTLLLWVVTGIWHGPEWRFIVWGFLNGVIIMASEEFTPLYEKFHKKYPKLTKTTCYRGFQVIRTFLMMSALKLFDVYGNVTNTFKQFFRMFTDIFSTDLSMEKIMELGLSYADYIILFVGTIVLFIVSMNGRKGSVRMQLSKKPYIVRYSAFLILFLATILFGIYGHAYDATQFIYNQF